MYSQVTPPLQRAWIAKENKSKWYRVYQPRPAASKRIVLLPHACGSASFFRSWCALFPESVEVVVVQYPGREDRSAEAMIDNMSALVSQLTAGLSGVLDKPFVLFGHSMGGAVAYELLRNLARHRLPTPAHLVVSAIEAPRRSHGGDLHLQDDDTLLRELNRLEGCNLDLQKFPELASMVLPLLRNDYGLIECYKPLRNSLPLAVPVTAMVGDRDDELYAGDAEAWQEETSGLFELQTFNGGHFYLKPEQTKVISALGKILAEVSSAAPARWGVMP